MNTAANEIKQIATISEWAGAHLSRVVLLTAASCDHNPQWGEVCDKARETMSTALFLVFGDDREEEASLFKICEDIVFVVENF